MLIKLLRNLTINHEDGPVDYKGGDVVEVPQWKGDALVNQRRCAELAEPPKLEAKKKRGRPPKNKAVESPPVNKMVDEEDAENK